MKDNFDDILKKKWEEFHFPVDDQHRADMIRLLDGQKRRRTGLFWWFGGIAVVGVGIFLLSMNTMPDTSLPFSNLENQASLDNTSTNHDSNTADTVMINNGTSDVKNDDAEVLHNTQIESNEGNLKSAAKNNADTNLDVLKHKIIPGRSSKMIPVQAERKQSNLKKNSTNPNPEFAESGDNKVEDPIEGNNSQSSIEVVEVTSNSAETSDAISKPFREDVITEEVEALPLGNLAYERKVSPKIEPARTHFRAFALFAEAGAGMVPAMKPDFTAGWTLHAGGGAKYSVSRRNSFSLTAGYMLQNGGFDFERTSTVRTNAFGARSNFNSLSPDKLHFVYARAGAHHSIRRHLLSVYGGIQYLYGAQGNISVVTQDAIAGESTDSQYAWLKLDGMQRYLWSAEVQYGYRITPKFSIHGGVKYYLSNLEAKDPELQSKGYYWNGKMAQLNPFLTLNYQLYERN